MKRRTVLKAPAIVLAAMPVMATTTDGNVTARFESKGLAPGYRSVTVTGTREAVLGFARINRPSWRIVSVIAS